MWSGRAGKDFNPSSVLLSLKFSPKLRVVFPQENSLFCLTFCVNGITLKYLSLRSSPPRTPTWLGFVQMDLSPLWTDGWLNFSPLHGVVHVS